MNEVDVINLKSLVNKYNNLIDKYQQNYLNVYNEIKNSNLYWVDPHALRFFEAKDIEKHKIDITYEELKQISNIYTYIIRKYESLGNYISFNIRNRDSIISKINSTYQSLQDILRSYSSLDYSFASGNISSSINNQINSIREMMYTLNEVKNNTKTYLDNIKHIEEAITSMINNLDIDVLPYATTERFV